MWGALASLAGQVLPSIVSFGARKLAPTGFGKALTGILNNPLVKTVGRTVKDILAPGPTPQPEV